MGDPKAGPDVGSEVGPNVGPEADTEVGPAVGPEAGPLRPNIDLERGPRLDQSLIQK